MILSRGGGFAWSGGGLFPGEGAWFRGVLLWGGLLLGGVPGSGGFCSGGPGSGGLLPGGAWSGGPGGDPLPGRLLLRAVRILLECILVNQNNYYQRFQGVYLNDLLIR